MSTDEYKEKYPDASILSEKASKKRADHMKKEKNPNWDGGKIETKCEYCDNDILKRKCNLKDNNFCSKNCYDSWRSENVVGKDHPLYESKIVECNNCGSSLEKQPHELEKNDKAFCDYECKGKWLSKNRKGKNHPGWKAKGDVCCDWCGKEFHKRPSNLKENNFCSRNCLGNWQSENNTGESNPFYGKSHSEEFKERLSRERSGKRSPNYGIERSKEFKEKLSKMRRGSDNPNWNGGKTYYYGSNWFVKRKEALKRDGYSCVVCGKGKDKLGKNPDVHHIKPISKFSGKEDANNLDNLITLCPEHHKNIEGWNLVPSNAVS